MSALDSQLMTLFSLDLFRQMAAGQPVTLFQFNLITNLLTERAIAYDVSFVPGNSKTAPALQLTVHISPTVTAVFVVSFSGGATAFTPSP